jgi:hypothetical protein
MKTRLFLFVFLTLTTLATGQNTIPEGKILKSNSVALGLVGGPAWPVGITYGQLLTDRISFELGAGVFSAGAGLHYYITDPRTHKFIPYTGLVGMISYDADPMFYIPAGISFLGKKNYQVSADAGILFSETTSLTGNGANPSPWFGLKLGKRFGEDIAIQRTREQTNLKNIVSINIGYFDILLGVVYERLITPYWGIEAGIGLIGVSLGTKLYFPPVINKNLGFHVGAITSTGAFPWIGPTGIKTYFPIGINYLAGNSVRLSFDVGPQYWFNSDEDDLWPGINIRVGKAF